MNCDFSDIPDAVSAFNRAQTEECKDQIKFLSCVSKQQKELYQNQDYKNGFLKLALDRRCPDSYDFNLRNLSSNEFQVKIDQSRFFQGCLLSETINDTNPDFKIHPEVKFLKPCIDLCLTSYLNKYAGYDDLTKKCVCIKSFNSSLFLDCESLQDDSKLKIYHTGLSGICKNVFYLV